MGEILIETVKTGAVYHSVSEFEEYSVKSVKKERGGMGIEVQDSTQDW